MEKKKRKMSFKLNRQTNCRSGKGKPKLFLWRVGKNPCVCLDFKIIASDAVIVCIAIVCMVPWSVGKKPTVCLDIKLLFRILETETKIPCV